MTFHYKNNIFYIIYILCYLLSGIIAFTGIIPFRLFFVTIPIFGLLIFETIIRQRIIFDIMIKIFIVFMMIVLISGILNKVTVTQIIYFSRYITTPLLIYFLCYSYISRINIKRIINISIWVAMIQLPIVIIQKLFYTQIISFASINEKYTKSVEAIDFDFGTFWWKDDAALSMFLIMIICFLLFDKKNNNFVTMQGLKIFWLIITVISINSMIGHLILGVLLLYYLIANTVVSKKMILFVCIIVSILSIHLTGFSEKWINSIIPVIKQITFQEISSETSFLEGQYSRSAAILYYLNRPVSLFGDGPSNSYNPLTKKYIVGNTGQIFIFYNEIGIIGLLLSYIIIYVLIRHNKKYSKEMIIPLFFIISAFTITSSVFSDASMMLACNIFASTGLLMNGNNGNNNEL